MKTVGLIVEYNPFHNGHLYHLEAAKRKAKADFVVCIMSGQFVQRGEPAIIDKWSRTKAALLSGADLVIELPVVFATSSAEFFSMAAVSLLNDLGIIDSFCFGSESGDLTDLDKLASLLYDEPDDYKRILGEYLKLGYNFPKARECAVSDYMTKDMATLLKTSNNILGVEYLKAVKRLYTNMKPMTIKRKGASYHDHRLNIQTASASAIRKGLKAGSSLEDIHAQLPDATQKAFIQLMDQGSGPVFFDDYFTLLRYTLIKKTQKDLNGILDMTEGLENRLLKQVKKASSLETFIDLASTKRYTNTKLQRALIHMLLDTTKEDFKRYVKHGYSQYIRILGFKQSAQVLLKEIKEKSKLPLVVNVAYSMNHLTSLQRKMLESDTIATEIYNTIVFDKYGVMNKNDYTQEIIKII